MNRRILRLGLNDLRLVWKDRSSLFWMAAFPIGMIVFFGMMKFGPGDPSDRRIRLTVVDRDQTWLSRALLERLEGEDFEIERRDEKGAEAEGRVRTLVIPRGFAGRIEEKKQVTLFLAREPGSSDPADMAAEVHVHRALVSFIAALAETDAGRAASDGESAEEVFGRLAAREPLVRVEPAFAGRGRPIPQGFGQSLPGMLTQFMIMIVLISGSVSITTEKAAGLLQRLACAPFTHRDLIVGKLFGLLLLALAQAAILIGAGFAMQAFGAEIFWGRTPAGLLLLILTFGTASAALGLFLGATLATPQRAGAVSWLMGMILAALGGCWWPLEIVPAWMQGVAHVFPTAWMMDALHDMMSFGKPLSAVVPEAGVLAGYAVVFVLLGARFLNPRRV